MAQADKYTLVYNFNCYVNWKTFLLDTVHVLFSAISIYTHKIMQTHEHRIAYSHTKYSTNPNILASWLRYEISTLRRTHEHNITRINRLTPKHAIIWKLSSCFLIGGSPVIEIRIWPLPVKVFFFSFLIFEIDHCQGYSKETCSSLYTQSKTLYRFYFFYQKVKKKKHEFIMVSFNCLELWGKAI